METRDWINTIEPRNVRAVMKRIVEDVTAIDSQVGQLYEEGVHKAHSSGLKFVGMPGNALGGADWLKLINSLFHPIKRRKRETNILICLCLVYRA